MPIDKILSVKNAQAWVSMVSYSKKQMKIKILKGKQSWEPFRICLLNSTANLAQFGRTFFFHCNIFILIYFFFEYETIETHARAFLTLNILSTGTVHYSLLMQNYFVKPFHSSAIFERFRPQCSVCSPPSFHVQGQPQPSLWSCTVLTTQLSTGVMQYIYMHTSAYQISKWILRELFNLSLSFIVLLHLYFLSCVCQKQILQKGTSALKKLFYCI